MATRSTIALEFADGSVQQIYCHWDGYLDHNGRILQEHYLDPFKVQRLIEGGAVSSLAPSIDLLDGHTFDLSVNKFKDYADYRKNAQSEEYNYILRQVDGKAVWFVEFYGEYDGPLVEDFSKETV
jgi:hypothetical protein